MQDDPLSDSLAHSHSHSHWKNEHVFDQTNVLAERNTRLVMWITFAMMVVEIVGGWWYNSMALLADGWHMSSHAVAIGLSAFAYRAARRYARDPRFAFGTWKVEVLGGFASAVFLLGVAALMAFSSAERLFTPQPIHYPEAIAIAALGLLVNLICALILGKAHRHGHGHGHGHTHAHPPHQDLNLQSAYTHVIADAATSVLAIIALAGGWLWGWNWLDPTMGLLGAVLVAVWAKGLIADTSKVLLDREMDHPVVQKIRALVETPQGSALQTRVTDLHVWRVGKNGYACTLCLVTQDPTLTPADVRQRLAVQEEVVHTTIEIHRVAHTPP
ncbi:MAG: CDF family Co(II)/Ni(II) efflux transporter DmeF [Rhodoferax sp.]|nr:CDF family Co(II)/Ni(II) efflux transporter DmeF [Rhodoferax sp.]